MESHSSCLTGLCDVCESRPRRCHCVNRLCLCVGGGGEKKRVSVARTLLDAQAVTAASHAVTRLESLRTFLCMRFIQASDKRNIVGVFIRKCGAGERAAGVVIWCALRPAEASLAPFCISCLQPG